MAPLSQVNTSTPYDLGGFGTFLETPLSLVVKSAIDHIDLMNLLSPVESNNSVVRNIKIITNKTISASLVALGVIEGLARTALFAVSLIFLGSARITTSEKFNNTSEAISRHLIKGSMLSYVISYNHLNVFCGNIFPDFNIDTPASSDQTNEEA